MFSDDVASTAPPIPPRRKKPKKSIEKTPKDSKKKNKDHHERQKVKSHAPLPPPRSSSRTRKTSAEDLSFNFCDADAADGDYSSHPNMLQFSNKVKPRANLSPLYFTFQDFEAVMAETLSMKFKIEEVENEIENEVTYEEPEDNDEEDVEFRVITTSIPFEKCLGDWSGSCYQNSDFDSRSDNSFIFDDYIDRTKRVQPPKLFASVDRLSPEPKAHTASKVRFALDEISEPELTSEIEVDNALVPVIEVTNVDELSCSETDSAPLIAEVVNNNNHNHTIVVEACIERKSDSTSNTDVVLEAESCARDTVKDTTDWYGSVVDEVKKLDGAKVKDEMSVDVCRGEFLEKMLNENEQSSCQLATESSKKMEPNRKMRMDLGSKVTKTAGEAKSDVLNELLNNFGALKLRAVQSTEHRSDEKTDIRLNAKVQTSVDKCAIISAPVISHHNVNDNKAMTPVTVSKHLSQREILPITPGSVRNRINYYEVQHNENCLKDSTPLKKTTRSETQVQSKRNKSTDNNNEGRSEDQQSAANSEPVPRQSCIKRTSPSPKTEPKKTVQFNSGCTVYEIHNREERQDSVTQTSAAPSTRKGITKRKAPRAPTQTKDSNIKTFKSGQPTCHAQVIIW